MGVEIGLVVGGGNIFEAQGVEAVRTGRRGLWDAGDGDRALAIQASLGSAGSDAVMTAIEMRPIAGPISAAAPSSRRAGGDFRSPEQPLYDGHGGGAARERDRRGAGDEGDEGGRGLRRRSGEESVGEEV